MQLLNIYRPTACDLIWQDILAYRKLFRYDLHFDEHQHYLTMNKTLFHKMLRIYDLSLQEDKPVNFCGGDANLASKDLLLKYIHLNHLSISQTLFKFLMSEELLLIKVFVLYMLIDDLDFIALYLQVNKKYHWYKIIEKIDKKDLFICETKDLSKYFRDFLDTFYFHSLYNVVQLKSTVFEQMDMEELLSLYPTCNVKQMTFYLQCSQKNHFYTIAQYMKMHQVSYETARKAMEQLVELKFYHKIKIGKKYVFTPVD
ncbi:MAG: hypothetical protein EOM11_07955 [Erysipelotrichia bacterium]|nr:hypothetical protein [Erysipelotrichia bacterium]